MKKNAVLVVAGSALIVLSTVQFAAAASEQKQRNVQRRAATEFRDSNAFAAPANESASSAYRYSGGGWSAPAGR